MMKNERNLVVGYYTNVDLSKSCARTFNVLEIASRLDNISLVSGPEGKYVEEFNGFFSREVVEEVGDFNNGLERGSDTEYGRRVLEEGYKCVLDPSIKVKHLKSDSILSFLKTKYKLGVSIKKQTDATEKIEEDRDTTDSTHILEAWKYYNSKVRFFEKPLFPFIGFLSVASRKMGEVGYNE